MGVAEARDDLTSRDVKDGRRLTAAGPDLRVGTYSLYGVPDYSNPSLEGLPARHWIDGPSQQRQGEGREMFRCRVHSGRVPS